MSQMRTNGEKELQYVKFIVYNINILKNGENVRMHAVSESAQVKLVLTIFQWQHKHNSDVIRFFFVNYIYWINNFEYFVRITMHGHAGPVIYVLVMIVPKHRLSNNGRAGCPHILCLHVRYIRMHLRTNSLWAIQKALLKLSSYIATIAQLKCEHLDWCRYIIISDQLYEHSWTTISQDPTRWWACYSLVYKKAKLQNFLALFQGTRTSEQIHLNAINQLII